MMKTLLTGLTVGLALATAPARAADVVRYRGTIESVDGSTVTIKPRMGETKTVTFGDDTKILAASSGKLSDI